MSRPKLPLRITTKAETDLAEIWAYVAQEARQAADSLIAEFHKKIDLLTEFPEIGAKRDNLAPRLRVLPCGRYVIYYISEESALNVIRILHGSRDARALLED